MGLRRSVSERLWEYGISHTRHRLCKYGGARPKKTMSGLTWYHDTLSQYPTPRTTRRYLSTPHRVPPDAISVPQTTSGKCN
eukprot:338093-Rhodomonas_salina.2